MLGLQTLYHLNCLTNCTIKKIYIDWLTSSILITGSTWSILLANLVPTEAKKSLKALDIRTGSDNLLLLI